MWSRPANFYDKNQRQERIQRTSTSTQGTNMYNKRVRLNETTSESDTGNNVIILQKNKELEETKKAQRVLENQLKEVNDKLDRFIAVVSNNNQL
jgi:hypothetical protein